MATTSQWIPGVTHKSFFRGLLVFRVAVKKRYLFLLGNKAKRSAKQQRSDVLFCFCLLASQRSDNDLVTRKATVVSC